MAITATSITPENTLEEFRIQFNNLVVDVDGVAAGNTFTQSIIFEGETADESETTLLATDPTADRTITLPDATGTVVTTGNSDAGATTTNSGEVSHVLVDVSGTLKKITASNLGIGGTTAADDLGAGDAAVNITTTSGNITIDAAANNSDIIFKGTDATSDITMLTLDGSEAGNAAFNAAITVGTTLSLIDDQKIILGGDSDISLRYDETTTDSLIVSADVDDAALGVIFQADAGADAGDEWKMNFANGGTFTFGNDIASAGTHTTLLTITPNSTAANSTHAFIGVVSASGGLKVPDDGNIGSASDADAIAIASNGDVSLTQNLSLVDNKEIVLGSNSDISLQYDESTTDSLVVSSQVNDAALGIVFQADDGADAGDEWKMNFANGGTFTFGNDIASAGTHTTMLTITPNSTAASSTMAFVGSITAAGNAVKTVGKETIYIPAAAMYPTTTSGCAALTQVEGTAGRPELKCLDFDPSSDENAQFTVAFPKSWNESTITFKAYFTVSGTDTGTVSWALSGVATADNDPIDVAFGTAVAPTAKAHSGTSGDINVTAESGNVTIAGSPSTDEMVFFNVLRDVSADNQAGDARLLGIQIFFTTDAANDA